jgi:hypothetical protein
MKLRLCFGVMVTIAMVLATSLAIATPAARPDLGIAALDCQTGALLWEAWERSDLPAQAPEDVRHAGMLLLQSKPDDPPSAQDGLLLSDWPVRLARNRAVRMEQRGSECLLKLCEWNGDSIGKELAHATIPFTMFEPSVLFSELLIVKTRDNRLYAFDATAVIEQQWRPVWTFDLLLKSPQNQKDRLFYNPTTLAVKDGFLWLATSERLTSLGSDGHTDFDLAFKDPLGAAWDAPVPQIVFKNDRLYYIHPVAVVAVDRTMKREMWRHYTTCFGFLSRVVETPKVVLVQVGSDCPRTIAKTIAASGAEQGRLGKITPNRVAAASVLLRSYGDGYPRLEVRKAADKYNNLEDADSRKAANAIEQTLRDWPSGRSWARLTSACVKALLMPALEADAWGQPNSERLLVWTVLQEMLYGSAPNEYSDAAVAFTGWREHPLGLTQAQRRDLREHCRYILEKGLESERPFATSLLLSDEVGDQEESSAQAERLFLNSQGGVWRWAATRMARDGKRSRLIELCKKRSQDDQLVVLLILSSRLPEKISPTEERFWMECLKANTPKAAYAARMARLGNNAPAPQQFRKPILLYLRKEVAVPTVLQNSQAEYEMEAAIDILDSWGKPEDVDLLRAYLRHPCATEGYRSTPGGKLEKMKVYSTRDRVAAMLKKRGVGVPDDVVLSEPWE